MIIRSFLALVLVFIGTRSSVAIDYPHIPSQPIDMDRDGRSDFYLLRLLYLNNAPTWVRQETLRLGTYDLFQTPEERLESPNGNSARVQDGQIALLSAGDIVGDAPHASQRWVDAFVPPYISVDNSLAFQAPGAWEGLWGAAREGFAGVRIAADDGVHYGWIKLRVENWNEETPNSIRLNGPLATDWYLESRPNTPIVAGAVPEPASVVLIFVSIACIVGLLRRRLVRRVVGILVLSLTAPIAARADRLEAVWIGPSGNGGAGEWHTPSNWNLGVVPNNGSDGNSDGVADIFDVRIDGGKADMSAVAGGRAHFEIANLSIDSSDSLELIHPLGFVLSSPDDGAEILNHGVLRVGMAAFVSPSLLFEGDHLQLSGSGTLQLGLVAGHRAHLVGLSPGSRITNGPGHTIRSAGRNLSGQIGAYTSGSVNGNIAFTNAGLLVADDRANLTLMLNEEDHFNQGEIRAQSGGRVTLSSELNGTVYNQGAFEAIGPATQLFIEGLDFINQENGLVRASDNAKLEINSITRGDRAINRGIIEAVGSGAAITIRGLQVINEEQGVVRASRGGAIQLFENIFRLDDSYQLLDAQSSLVIDRAAIVENAGRVLSPGPGKLVLGSARIRGGEISSGDGQIQFSNFAHLSVASLLEDVTLSGTVTGGAFAINGSLSVDSGVTFKGPVNVFVGSAHAVLRGPGISRFEDRGYFNGPHTLQIAADHTAEFSSFELQGGTLLNDGIVRSEDHIYVWHRAKLEGTGTIVVPQLHAWGEISPGDGIGALTVLGDAYFNSSSSYFVELAGDDADLLRLTGSLNLQSDESLKLTGGVAGRSYVIAQYGDELFGKFDDVTPGYDVVYDNAAKLIRVMVVPEPASVVLALMGIAGAVALRRRFAPDRTNGECEPPKT